MKLRYLDCVLMWRFLTEGGRESKGVSGEIWELRGA